MYIKFHKRIKQNFPNSKKQKSSDKSVTDKFHF